MIRLRTADCFVVEVDNKEDFRKAVSWLRDIQHGKVNDEDRSSATNNESAGGSSGQQNSQENIQRFGRTDRQRRLLEALASAEEPLSSEQLAKEIGTDKNRALGTLGSIYAYAGEQRVMPSELVRRAERRNSSGRRVYFYAAGRMLGGT